MSSKIQTPLLLSATIATYNAAPFIRACLKSILNQTFSDFELICIDDGSTDQTLKIIQEYAAKDQRIRVIANPNNHGLAVIRNQSLAEAKGKYILFLDGDDLYDPTYFEKALQLAEKEQSDLVICDYVVFYENKDIEELKKQPSALLDINPKDKITLLKRPAFTWVKLIKTQTAKDLKIFFPPGLTRQDIPVHWQLITSVDKIALLPERLAFYRQQPEATTAKKDKKLFHLAYVMDIVKEFLLENHIYDRYQNEFLRQQLNLLNGMYDNVKKEYKAEAMQIIKERLTDEHALFVKIGDKIRKPAELFYLSLEGDELAKAKLRIWKSMRYVYRKIKS